MYSEADVVKEVLLKLRDGDSETITQLYHHFMPKVKRFVLQNSGSASDARDLFQECIFYLYRYAKDGTFTVLNLDAYFINMCRNQWYQELRKRQREADTLTTVEQEPNSNSDRYYYAYLKAFSELGTDCQKVLELYIQGLPVKAISQELETTIDYAKRKKYLCKEQLKKLAWDILKNNP